MILIFIAQPFGVGLYTVKGWGCDFNIYSLLGVGCCWSCWVLVLLLGTRLLLLNKATGAAVKNLITL